MGYWCDRKSSDVKTWRGPPISCHVTTELTANSPQQSSRKLLASSFRHHPKTFSKCRRSVHIIQLATTILGVYSKFSRKVSMCRFVVDASLHSTPHRFYLI